MKDKLIFGFIGVLARLPLALLYPLADIISLTLYYLVRYRKKVVEANLQSAFPEKSRSEIKKIEKKFYRYLGDQIVETVKLLHISPRQLQRRVTMSNIGVVNDSLREGKCAVVLMGHYGNWEWVQEITRELLPGTYMCSIYHPLKNKAWDDFSIRLRSRWHAHIVAMKKATRILLDKDNRPWVCGFISDARPDVRHDENTVEFLNHKTRFITGPEIIGHKVGADYFYLDMVRIKRGYYEIRFSRLQPSSTGQSFPHLREFWKEFEESIRKAPAYWLWSHKRWK